MIGAGNAPEDLIQDIEVRYFSFWPTYRPMNRRKL